MDYNQEQFFRMQMDVPKMPFYMSYPMQNLYLTEMEYEKDMERMKELYPKEVKTILSPYYYLQQNDIIYVTPNKAKARNSDVGNLQRSFVCGTLRYFQPQP